MRNRKGVKYTENKWQRGRSTSLTVITCKWMKCCWPTGTKDFKKTPSNYILSTKDLLHIQNYQQVEENRWEKIFHDFSPWFFSPKESWNGYINIREYSLKVKKKKKLQEKKKVIIYW